MTDPGRSGRDTDKTSSLSYGAQDLIKTEARPETQRNLPISTISNIVPSNTGVLLRENKITERDSLCHAGI